MGKKNICKWSREGATLEMKNNFICLLSFFHNFLTFIIIYFCLKFSKCPGAYEFGSGCEFPIEMLLPSDKLCDAYFDTYLTNTFLSFFSDVRGIYSQIWRGDNT